MQLQNADHGGEKKKGIEAVSWYEVISWYWNIMRLVL